MPVLGTKLRVPAPRRQLVGRPRLTDQLLAASGSMPRLVLVSAPAGFGKTTLLAQWIASDGGSVRVAWLSLDESDADPARFLTHLIAALQLTSPGVGVGALALIEHNRTVSTEAVLVSLVNDLDISAEPTVIALDDYHVIDTAAVHDIVTFLLNNLPRQVTLAITTRADPPLPLSRLRARGEIVELRASDLRFTPSEADAFLNQVMGLDLEPAHVAALGARTEGWVAGLQLAALAARGRAGGIGSFVHAFTGSHRFILDYLLDEVLRSQPEDVRAFLLDTSLLHDLTGPLCDAVSGRQDGQQMLEDLERSNLFIVPLDDRRVVPLPPAVRRRAPRPAHLRTPGPSTRAAPGRRTLVRRPRPVDRRHSPCACQRQCRPCRRACGTRAAGPPPTPSRPNPAGMGPGAARRGRPGQCPARDHVRLDPAVRR